MARAHSVLAAVILCVGAALPRVAAAEPIRITSGTLEVTDLGPASFDPSRIHLEGTRGFTLDAIGGEGRFGPALDCFYGCSPDQVVSLDALWGGLDLNGTATLDGMSWSHIGGASDDASALVSFAAQVMLPATIGDSVTLTVPFSFTGWFTHGATGPEVLTEALAGRGTVTTTFERSLTPGAGFYRPSSTVFTFSTVVPEPGTLTLLGTGMLAAVRAAVVRRRSRRR